MSKSFSKDFGTEEETTNMLERAVNLINYNKIYALNILLKDRVLLISKIYIHSVRMIVAYLLDILLMSGLIYLLLLIMMEKYR